MRKQLRSLEESDWPCVKSIYTEGIETGIATLETSSPSYKEWDERHLPFGRLVLEMNEIVGWAALSPVSNRCVYGGVAEVSVYVSRKFYGNGFGKELLQGLIDESEKNGIWTLIAGIFPENVASCKLHEKMGFRLIGTQEKISKLNDVWMDVRRYERRSTKVGL
ncbi:MAG: N-acetyltransferase [Bacteroidia bacterium]|nr:N-acetyltransferase [Bacteroidia bacterium]